MDRYLVTVPDDRENDHTLHVSDLTKNKWCPRMLFYRMGGIRPALETVSFQLQNIYDYGTETHLKFQRRWRDMGELWGRWKCLECEASWIGMPPTECPKCGVRNAIIYAEVPLAAPEFLLFGNADGEVRDSSGNVLAEVKTVGEGTFRVEAPKMLREYTKPVTFEDGHTENYVDIKQLWRDLRRPLPSHGRQGQTYLELRSKIKDQPPVDGISFLYEHKGNQGLKEFFVQPDKKVAEEVLGRAADVAYAVNRCVAPRCLEGREGCDLCQPYEEEARKRAGTKPQGAADRPAGASRPTTRRLVLSGGKRI